MSAGSPREAAGAVLLVRHAETEWSLSGRHTGRVDIPLTARGRAAAQALAGRLGGPFARVLVSPSVRARETCALAGLAGSAEERADLLEWDYGDYEGLTTPEIQARRPGWNLWRDGCPHGEDAADVGSRTDRVIEELLGEGGEVAVFSHGHTLRVLGARWIGLPPRAGAGLGLSAGAVSRLGHERDTPILALWNETRAP